MSTKRKMHRDTIYPISISGINNKYKRFSQYQRNQKKRNTKRERYKRACINVAILILLFSSVNRPLSPRICAWFQSRLIFPHFTISINHSSIARTNPFHTNSIRCDAIQSNSVCWIGHMETSVCFSEFFMILKQKQT